jgi:hypothetical protein
MFNTSDLTDGIEVQRRPARGGARYVVVETIDDETLLATAEKTAALSGGDVEETKRQLVERAVADVVMSEVPPGADVLVKCRYDVDI